MDKLKVKGEACFSPDRQYRHYLLREWSKEPKVVFIGLNPSSADEHADDPTTRRCIQFAEKWGGGGIVMLNLFDLVSSDPYVLRVHSKPESSENVKYLDFWLNTPRSGCDRYQKGLNIIAWGKNGSVNGRYLEFLERYSNTEFHYIKLNGDGSPSHPLHLSTSLNPVKWENNGKITEKIT